MRLKLHLRLAFAEKARYTLFSTVNSVTDRDYRNSVLDKVTLNEGSGRPMIIYTLGESGNSTVHPLFYPEKVNKMPIESDANDLLTFL